MILSKSIITILITFSRSILRPKQNVLVAISQKTKQTKTDLEVIGNVG